MNNEYFFYKGQKFQTGKKVTCKINDYFIDDAKIYITKSYCYILHYCEDCAGRSAPSLLGYKHSWAFIFNEDDQTFSDHITLLKLKNGNFIDPINEMIENDKTAIGVI